MQQSTVNSQQSTVNSSVNRIGVILAVLSLTLILGGCDAPKPKSFVIDTSLELDRTFEEPDYGFQFSYPGTFPFEEGQGIFSKGTATLYFSPDQKLDSSTAMMTVEWLGDDQTKKTKGQIENVAKKNGGTLKSFEKINLNGQNCTHIRIAFGGMLDARGSRISEQYFLTTAKDTGLIINFSGPEDMFESYRPKFNAVLQSFKFGEATTESE